MRRMSAGIAVLGSALALGLAQPTAPTTYENLDAVLWMQTAVEYKASAVQTYRLAQAALLQGLRDPHWTAAIEQTGDFGNLPPAVILDLDETVIENSAFQARMITSPDGYSVAAWNKWMEEESATLVPGAIDFLQFAHANGVTPIYITNRTCDTSKADDPTVQVLRKLRVPLDSAPERIFCNPDSKSSDKTARRAMVAAKFRILLLFGDQLGDFVGIPADAANLEGREKLYEAYQGLFGERWFQLPNPMYGSWEGVVGNKLQDKLKHLRQQ
jgi:acid phosphatase